MRPTALGLRALLFLAVLWATFFAIPYTNLFFFGITFLTVWILLAAVWTWRNVHGLRASGLRGAGHPGTGPAVCVPADSPFRLQFDAAPRGRPRSGIGVHIGLPSGSRRSPAVPLEGTATSVTVDVPALPRGIHEVQRAVVESSAPFGLFTARATLPGLQEVVVHPSPTPRARLRRHARASEAKADRAARSRPPRVDQVTGLREYRTGDDPRTVHWRGSARRGTLVVREADPEPETAWEVVLDRRVEHAAFEVALSDATALALRARDEKAVLCLQTQGMSRAFACGGADLDALLRILASLSTVEADAGPPTVGRPRGRGARP